MDTQEEHLRGTHMYVVRPTNESGLNEEDIKWKIISVLVEDYAKIHPNEIREIIEENRQLNQIQANEFGSNQEGMRFAFRCPPGLIRVIERRFPNIFIDKENIHKFMTLFPGFRISDRV